MNRIALVRGRGQQEARPQVSASYGCVRWAVWAGCSGLSWAAVPHDSTRSDATILSGGPTSSCGSRAASKTAYVCVRARLLPGTSPDPVGWSCAGGLDIRSSRGAMTEKPMLLTCRGWSATGLGSATEGGWTSSLQVPGEEEEAQASRAAKAGDGATRQLMRLQGCRMHLHERLIGWAWKRCLRSRMDSVLCASGAWCGWCEDCEWCDRCLELGVGSRVSQVWRGNCFLTMQS